MSTKKQLSAARSKELLNILRGRFEKNPTRLKGIEWEAIQQKLEANPGKLWSLNEMENTGGEPDVVGFDKKTSDLFFMIVRRSLRKSAGAFALIAKRGSQEKNISRQIM